MVFPRDYTSPLQNVILETEKVDGGLTYRYTYGLHKENVVVYGIENGQGSLLEPQHYLTGDRNIVKLYYHQNHLGSTDYLTANKDNKLGEVVSYADYDDWGRLIGNSIVEMGIHKLDLVEEYTGYTYDRVLDLYYAKARMYDAADRRFMAVDLVKGTVANPQTIAQYVYCLNNSLIFIDPLGFVTKNPVDLLSDKTNFANVSTTTYDGSTYYQIRGVMEVLGGKEPYYNDSTKTSTLSLYYDAITLTVSYNVSRIKNKAGKKGEIVDGFGIYFDMKEWVFNYPDNLILPVLYKGGSTYVDLDVLKKYFEQIWCGSQEVIDKYGAKDAFDRYLNGQIDENHPDYKLAIDWWSGKAANSTVTYKSIKQFTSQSYIDLDRASNMNRSMSRFKGISTAGYDYNRYDDIILAHTNYLNDRFGKDLDPNLVKAIAAYESHMGYFSGASSANSSIDIMQVLDNGNPAIHRLAAEGKFDKNEAGAYIPKGGYSLFKRLYPSGTYDGSKATIDMSIMGGTIWFMHKSTFAKYNGGGDPFYQTNVDFVLSTMR